jgi:hypothetical protein
MLSGLATLVALVAVPLVADDACKATGILDGRKVTFAEDDVSDGVKATVGLLESCHSESLFQSDELEKALQGDHVRLVLPKPMTAKVTNEKIAFSELVLRLPLNTGVFWVRKVDTWRRYSKYEFQKEKPLVDWIREARSAK